ncbi:hypothetical protein ACMA1D_29055 [Streptomyces sp. 796.1]|uniref:hypothetical protein n=1 Tax=Streptomyces sp. 796.1 TaxID=3163029 RepID=UPI0039C9206B
MSTPETSQFVRLRVELVLEVTDAEQLAVAAREQIDGDPFMPAEEREHARLAIRDDQAEALAYLIDPGDLVKEVPGLELAQASWSSEPIDFDPDAEVWGLDDDLDDDEADDEPDDEADDEPADGFDAADPDATAGDRLTTAAAASAGAGAGHDVGLGGHIDAAADDPDATYDPAGGWAAGGYRQP